MEEADGPNGPPPDGSGEQVAQGLGEGRRKPRRLLLPAESEESTSQRLKKTTGEAPLGVNNLPTKRAAWGGGSVLGPWPHSNRWAEYP